MLFALYIAELEERLTKSNLGIAYGAVTVPALLFADNIVLLAENPDQMTKLLHILTTFCNMRHLEINPKKSAALQLVKSGERNFWAIQNITLETYKKIRKIIGETDQYKYLGIVINAGSSRFVFHNKKLINKARVLALQTTSLANRSFNKWLITDTMWRTIALPAITYGMEIIPSRVQLVKQLDKFQTHAYKHALNLPISISTMGLLGKIGVLPIQYLWDERKLLYIHRLEKLEGQNHLCRQIYEETIAQAHTPTAIQKSSWLYGILKLVTTYNIDFDHLGSMHRLQWEKHVKEKVREKWERDWQDHQQKRKIPQGFVRLDKPTLEPYIRHKHAREIVLLRNNCFMKNVFKIWQSEQLKLQQCLLCNTMGSLSDSHILLECMATSILRNDLLQNLDMTTWDLLPTRDKIRLLLGYGSPLEPTSHTYTFLTQLLELVQMVQSRV